MTYTALARKWRPKAFGEMSGQEHVLKALSNALESGRVHHAFLFTGTRGVGKTTVARIFAKCLNCTGGPSVDFAPDDPNFDALRAIDYVGNPFHYSFQRNQKTGSVDFLKLSRCESELARRASDHRPLIADVRLHPHDARSTRDDGKPLIQNQSFAEKIADLLSDLMNHALDLEDAMIAIMGFQNDRGLLINVMPRSLIIARQEWYNANRILKSVFQSGTANNDINVLKATNAIPEGIVMNHYLTSPHAWFLRTNIQNGMKYYERVGITFDQDNDFDTMNAKAKGYERYSFGWSDPRAVYGVNGP